MDVPAHGARLRVWDLPTRLFHGLLIAGVVAMVVTAKRGGDAMEWHLRIGQAMAALLLFRLGWGLFGGHWSRLSRLAFGPRDWWRDWRGQTPASLRVGHAPLGALAVAAMLGLLLAQVASGMLSDDGIAYAGPLVGWVGHRVVDAATAYHKALGQWLVLGLVALHVAAVAFHQRVRREALVGAMWHGDKAGAPAGAPASRDGARERLRALLWLIACWLLTAALWRAGGLSGLA